MIKAASTAATTAASTFIRNFAIAYLLSGACQKNFYSLAPVQSIRIFT
jgi:hypothetical protein